MRSIRVYIEGVKNALAICFFAVALLVALYAISLITPIVGDYFSFFRPSTLAFLRGESNLYDSASPGFFNAPWALALWIPFVSFPYAIGQAAHELVYILFFIAAVALLRQHVPLPGVLFAIFNIPAFVLIVAAGIDSFALLGVALILIATRRRHTLLFAVALFILATKPQNVILVAALCLYSFRAWKSLLLPLAAAAVSALFIGLDWPLRYWAFMSSSPPLPERRVELWNTVPPIALVPVALVALIALLYLVRRDGFNDWTFSIALTTNLVFTPYALWVHFVLLVPVLLFVARLNVGLAAVIWLSSWLLPQFGMAYPIVAFLVLWWVVLRYPLALRSVSQWNLPSDPVSRRLAH